MLEFRFELFRLKAYWFLQVFWWNPFVWLFSCWQLTSAVLVQSKIHLKNTAQLPVSKYGEIYSGTFRELLILKRPKSHSDGQTNNLFDWWFYTCLKELYCDVLGQGIRLTWHFSASIAVVTVITQRFSFGTWTRLISHCIEPIDNSASSFKQMKLCLFAQL